MLKIQFQNLKNGLQRMKLCKEKTSKFATVTCTIFDNTSKKK